MAADMQLFSPKPNGLRSLAARLVGRGRQGNGGVTARWADEDEDKLAWDEMGCDGNWEGKGRKCMRQRRDEN